MDEKIDYIKQQLSLICNSVDYSYSNYFHKFRINSNPKRWLYIEDEFLDDNNLSYLEKIIKSTSLVEVLKSSTNSCWYSLNANGLIQVDENFTKS